VDISTLANLINAIAVTAGVIFAATQIRDYRRQRKRDAMLNLVQSFQSPAFARGLRRVIELPDDASAEKIREILGPDGEDLMVHVTATWETIGVLLFHGELSIDIIDDFFSGPILISWKKTAAVYDGGSPAIRSRNVVGVVSMAGRTDDGTRKAYSAGAGLHRPPKLAMKL
jgi:hypothetical protein